LFERNRYKSHTEILAGLGLETKELERILDRGDNIWKYIIDKFTEQTKKDLEYDYLKGSIKKICYKCLQGGRVHSPEAIYKTIAPGNQQIEHQEAKRRLADELYSIEIVQEFDRLNKEIADKYKDRKLVHLFTPFDQQAFIYSNRKGAGCIRNSEQMSRSFTDTSRGGNVYTYGTPISNSMDNGEMVASILTSRWIRGISEKRPISRRAEDNRTRRKQPHSPGRDTPHEIRAVRLLGGG
jgi:hypothetical protein